MKKNLLFGMLAAASMLLATSCSNDELDADLSGNEATVSFSIGVESAVQTRSNVGTGTTKSRVISDGTGADRLVYAVFDEDGNRLTNIAKIDKTTTFPATETIKLAKGQTYKVAFWAQNSATSAYVLDDNMNLTIDYTGGANNDEERDAFFKTETFTVTGNTTIDVKLKRPFAQLNVGVTDEDWEAAAASGINIMQSKVVISKVASKMNLVDGSVSTPIDIEYSLGDIPTERLTVADRTYKYLSMSYFLVNDATTGAEKATLENVEFTFQPVAGNAIVLRKGLESVPVQRNWRTNILGQLLTGTIDFNIVIDPIYDGEYNGVPFEDGKGVKAGDKYYTTLDEALSAGENDILLAVGEHGLNVNLANRAVKIAGVSKDAKIKYTGINMAGSTVVFENVTMVTPNTIYKGFTHAEKITFNDCAFDGMYFCYCLKTIFNDCTFNQSDVEYNIWTYACDVDLNNCEFNSAGKSVLIYAEGGDLKNVNINDCKFKASAPANDGKAAIEIDGRFLKYVVKINNCTSTGFDKGSVSGNSLWNVKKGLENVEVTVDGQRVDNAVTMNGVKYGNLKALLATVAAGGSAEITLAGGTYVLPAEARGKTLNFTGVGDASNTVIKCSAEGSGNLYQSTVTFENLTIETDNTTYRGFTHVSKSTYKDCIINNCLTLYNDGSAPMEFDNCTFNVSGDNYNLWTWGVSAAFNKCTFNCDGKGVLVYGPSPESTVTFNTCSFNDYGGINGKAAIETGDDYTVKYDIHINGCKVNGFDVTSQKKDLGGDNLGTNVWGNKDLMPADRLNVFIDNKDVY